MKSTKKQSPQSEAVDQILDQRAQASRALAPKVARLRQKIAEQRSQTSPETHFNPSGFPEVFNPDTQ